MRRIATWTASLGLLALANSAGASAQDGTFEWIGEIGRGQTLEVKGISGNVRASLARGQTVGIAAEKHGRRSDFDEVKVHVVEHDGGITVCAVYFEWDRSEDPCSDDRDRPWHGDRRHRSIDVDVDFEVQVPAGVTFVGATISGDVEAVDLRSIADVSTVNGDVRVSTSEYASATTVNGSIDVEMTGNAWDDLEFVTVSGDITIHMPSGVGTEVEFESLSGDFRTDFNLISERRRDRFVGSRVEGTIGDGSRYMSFTTVSGDVRLRRTG